MKINLNHVKSIQPSTATDEIEIELLPHEYAPNDVVKRVIRVHSNCSFLINENNIIIG